MNVLLQARFVAEIRFMNNIVGKRKGIENWFTEKWVIKIVKRFREKLLICFQMNFFAFPRTWLSSYVSLDESHVFSSLNKSFSMQIKNFSWALSSDKREFSSEKVVFLPTSILFTLWTSSLSHFHANSQPNYTSTSSVSWWKASSGPTFGGSKISLASVLLKWQGNR